MLNPLVRAPQPADLAAPVGTIMRPTLSVEVGDSLARGAQTLRENGGRVLPVVDEAGRLQGVLTDAGLARALAEASEATDAVAGFLRPADTIAPYASGAEALRQSVDGETLVVVDDGHRPVGLVSAVDLWPRRRVLPRPAMVGGMATPFGVYLTTGSVSAGVPWWALLGTGAAMFGMLLAGLLAADAVAHVGMPIGFEWVLTGAVFLLLMRLSPMSGIHGAEHQVVHAIEREEILTADVVRRMPLVHPRCGTNLVVGLSIFLGLQSVKLVADNGGELLALIAAITFAMPVGSLVQRYFMAKTPSERQLSGAIRAGEALLQANATARNSQVKPLHRIWSMGVLQVMVGASAVVFLVAALKVVTHASWLPDLTR